MTSSIAAKFAPWDVVLVPFPYTERAHAKVRPAVIVSTTALASATGLHYVAMITNAAHRPWVGDVAISDLDGAGLPVASVVRPAKIATIDQQALIRKIGALPKGDRTRVAASIRKFLAFRNEVP